MNPDQFEQLITILTDIEKATSYGAIGLMFVGLGILFAVFATKR